MSGFSKWLGRKNRISSDLVDLWVIKKQPAILCARSTSRSSEQSTKRRSRSEKMRKVYLFCSLNNDIVWLSNMADTFLEKFTGCARVCGLFLSVDWLSRQTLITCSWHYEPVSQSGAVAKNETFWRTTRQSNLADRIEHFHVTSLPPDWRAKTIHFLASGK